MTCHEGKKLTCCLTIYNRQDQESIDRIKLWYIPLGTLLSHRKKEIMPFAATWMDLDIIILSQKQISYDICYM